MEKEINKIQELMKELPILTHRVVFSQVYFVADDGNLYKIPSEDSIGRKRLAYKLKKINNHYQLNVNGKYQFIHEEVVRNSLDPLPKRLQRRVYSYDHKPKRHVGATQIGF